MKLVYKETGKEVKVGDIVEIKGCKAEVSSFEKPHKPSSQGKVSVKDPNGTWAHEFYVDIIGAEWIEREDRKPKEFHYFASSPLYWTTHKDLETCLRRQRLKDRNKKSDYSAFRCAVYKVPLPENSHYKINEYRPEVEGTELVAVINYEEKK